MIEKSTILVIGSSGYVGSNLIKQLSCENCNIYGIQRSEKNVLGSNIQIINCDVKDFEKLNEIIRDINPTYIFHMAGNTSRSISLDTLDEMIDVNLIGTLNVLKSCIGLNALKALIVFGTSEEYGKANNGYHEELKEDPISPYSFSKTASYYLCKLFYNIYGVPFIFLRPSLIYGPGQPDTMFIPSLISALKENREFKMTAGEQTRNFIYVDDAIECAIRAATSENCIAEIINIGNENAKIIDVARSIATMMDKAHLIKPGEIDYRENEIMNYNLDCTKMHQQLNWKPQVCLTDGLKKTIDGTS
jgi:UDP-glucose 4-epimerase